MSSWEKHGWHHDRPCPPWCESTDHHLQERIDRRTDSFWHRGPTTLIPTDELTRDDEPVDAQVFLSQKVLVDERGFNTRPALIALDCGGSLTADAARELAAALLDLASQADRVNQTDQTAR